MRPILRVAMALMLAGCCKSAAEVEAERVAKETTVRSAITSRCAGDWTVDAVRVERSLVSVQSTIVDRYAARCACMAAVRSNPLFSEARVYRESGSLMDTCHPNSDDAPDGENRVSPPADSVSPAPPAVGASVAIGAAPGATCADGTPANCTGRGCCSHHGGVSGGTPGGHRPHHKH